MASIPEDVSSSGSEMSTDSGEDRRFGYKTPVPRGPNLRVIYLVNKEAVVFPVCPVCLWKADQWQTSEAMKEHVLEVATCNIWKEYCKKIWSRHHILARNEGWLKRN